MGWEELVLLKSYIRKCQSIYSPVTNTAFLIYINSTQSMNLTQLKENHFT